MAMTTMSRIVAALGVLLTLGHTGIAGAVEYRASASGDWSNAKTWRPRGVPGVGDKVVSLGRHTVTVDGSEPVHIGDGTATAALVLDGSGALLIEENAQLVISGHLLLSSEGARVQVGPSARLLFAPKQQQWLQLQMYGARQRLEFAGKSAARGEIGLVADSAATTGGGWFVASNGHRDSVLAGRYGRISDALDPESGKAWTMYLANTPNVSRLVASSIEFVNSGQVGVLGLDAGEFTEVDMQRWSFKASHPAAAGLPALWFDGYGDLPVQAPASQVKKRIRDLVSDKEIYLRYVQGYELESWVLGASGQPGSVRANNNGGNAAVQRQLFQVVRDSGGVGMVADLTDTVYMYSEADNPHGFSTRELRGDAVLRNFWFESHYPNQSDTGDAILTNGPQGWVSQHGGTPVTLTVEHSGSIGDTSHAPSHPVFLTVNEGTGMHFRLRQNFMRQPVRFNAIALDENGVTPSGTGLEFTQNLIYSPELVEGFAIGSAAGKSVVNADAFRGVDRNLYFNLQPRKGFGGGIHAIQGGPETDAQSMTLDPKLVDGDRTLASWDAMLGGPGTADHAIAELQKLNDDTGFDPRYRVIGLVTYVAGGRQPTNAKLLGADGAPIVGPVPARYRRQQQALEEK